MNSGVMEGINTGHLGEEESCIWGDSKGVWMVRGVWVPGRGGAGGGGGGAYEKVRDARQELFWFDP